MARRRQMVRLALAAAAGLALPIPAGAAAPRRADLPRAPALGRGRPFRLGSLHAHARKLADGTARAGWPDVPAALSRLDFDAYRHIGYRHGAELWRHEPRAFELAFFHPGYLYNRPMRLHIVADGQARPIRFDPRLFAYGDPLPEAAVAAAHKRDDALGFAGWRAHYPLGASNHPAEFLVFQGATYCRAVAAGQRYGSSLRAVSVNTDGPEAESFPAFTDFYIEAPAPGTAVLTAHGVFDGPAVAGVTSCTARPGSPTVLEVTTTLYPKRRLDGVGIAPLTSMFHHGPGHNRFDGTFRPAVHDSEALAVAGRDGGRTWRALTNPSGVAVTGYDAAPAGFGLIQRARSFAHYQDGQARYDRRPSLWVTPAGDWGTGQVKLVELPTATETNDNIVAFWRPAAPLPAGRASRWRYTVTVGAAIPAAGRLAKVRSTRAGDRDGARHFLIDFAEVPGAARPQPWVDAPAGSIRHQDLRRHPTGDGWRLAVTQSPDRHSAGELACALMDGNERLSETWRYPARP